MSRPEMPPMRGPSLRSVYSVFELRRSDPEGLDWRTLHERVGAYTNAVELSDRVRSLVREYVTHRLAAFKEKAHGLGEIPDEVLLDAIVENQYEGLDQYVGETRKEILWAVAAHVVRRIETNVFRRHLEECDESQLEKLGLTPQLRDLTVELLDTGIKADPLFIRFLAYSQLAGKPPKEASPEGLFIPGDERAHTIAELFPKETQFIVKRFEKIAESRSGWTQAPGAETFQEYVQELSEYYGAHTPQDAKSHRLRSEELYRQLIVNGFPVLLTSATEGYYKEPYLDPELKVSVATPEAVHEEAAFRKAQQGMADNLGLLGAERFRDALAQEPIRASVVFGAFGVNLSFNAPAQEHPVIVLFLDEQIRRFDRSFPGYLRHIERGKEGFSAIGEEERRPFIERISRMIVMLHEFGHFIHRDKSPEAERLGRRPLTIIDEVKAEAVYRPLMPAMCEAGTLEGTKEQWLVAMIASSLQVLKMQAEGDPYYYADAYNMNNLFAEGGISFDGERIRIDDPDTCWRAYLKGAKQVIGLYEDEGMTERKAAGWIRTHCTPGEKVGQALAYLKGRELGNG